MGAHQWVPNGLAPKNTRHKLDCCIQIKELNPKTGQEWVAELSGQEEWFLWVQTEPFLENLKTESCHYWGSCKQHTYP